MNMRVLLLLIGIASGAGLSSFAGSLSKEYETKSLVALLHIQCDENRVARSVLAEDPEAPSFLKGKREFSLNVEGLSGNFYFLKEKNELDFEVGSSGNISFVKKGGFFSRDQKVLIGRADVAGGCWAEHHKNMVVSSNRGIEPALTLDIRATITITSGCQSRSNWPDDGGKTYWRDTVEMVTFTDRATGKSLSFNHNNAVSYSSETDCQRGMLP